MTVGTTNVSLSTLPASISQIVQSGLLVGEFQAALEITHQYPLAYQTRTTPRNYGETFTETRDALLAAVQDPITPTNTGLDSGLTARTVGREQWAFTMNIYADTIDTTVDENTLALANLFRSNLNALATGAGRTDNLQCRRRITYAYAGGRTHATNAATVAATSLTVANANGFDERYTNGVAANVSGSNTLTVTVNGTSNVVSGATSFTRTNASDMVSGTLTLGTSQTWSIGDAIIASSAPASIRPNSRTTSYNLTSTDTITYQNIVNSTAILRNNGVPGFFDNGLYLFLGDAQHEANLFADAAFREFYRGQYQSEDVRMGKLMISGGVAFSFGNEPPNSTSWGASSITARRAFVLGGSAAAKRTYDMGGMTDDNMETNPISSIYRDPDKGLKVIVRPALDRRAQIISASYELIFGLAMSTDSLSTQGEYTNAVFKRGVCIETA